jgi:BMFP domain-containing protein YqiC
MTIKDILHKIGDKLPDEVKILSQEARTATRDLLQEKLHQLNLVTRQEFDMQTQALLAAQARVEELTKQVTVLEEKLFNQKSQDN